MGASYDIGRYYGDRCDIGVSVLLGPWRIEKGRYRAGLHAERVNRCCFDVQFLSRPLSDFDKQGIK